MTIIRLSTYIPKNDIKIRPKYMLEEMYKVFEKYLEEIDPKNSIIIENLYKNFKEKVRSRYFWYEISSKNTCCYEYTGINKDNITKICGRRIDVKHAKDDS
jgi:hypothetical protein